jgi:hypothetical protein
LSLLVTWNAELLRLDGNAALADIDLDAGDLASFPAEAMAEHHGDDDERGDDEVENVTFVVGGPVQVSEARVLRST